MKNWKTPLLLILTITVCIVICTSLLIRRGFRATTEPSRLETLIAGRLRNASIPLNARRDRNPLQLSAGNLRAGREIFLVRCASCHGIDGTGVTQLGRSLYPRAPNLHSQQTQDLSDGEIHYIIENGVQLTGMPAWGNLRESTDDIWQLVIFVRSMRPLTPQESSQHAAMGSAHYVGSAACEKCHTEIYARWEKTPMANVVRNPREHPDAIIPDLATNHLANFSQDQIGFVYGSLWKQRYFTKIGSDYYPLPLQWEAHLEQILRSSRHRLVGNILSPRQYAAAHWPHV